MNRHHLSVELNKILDKLAEFCGCTETRLAAKSIVPAASYRQAIQEMQCTADAHALSNRLGTPSIYQVQPCQEAVRRAHAGGILSLREMLDCAYLLKTARSLINWKKQSEEPCALDFAFSELTAVKSLEESIGDAILSEEELSDHASSELYDIRRKIRSAQQRTREHLDKLIRSSHTAKYLQEQIITLRNGRFVVPVKVEHRGEIKGLVHDTSASGATLFIEPMSVVEQNNHIRELESREQHEIDRILRAFSAEIGAQAEVLLRNYTTILALDLFFAKSRLADSMRATVPMLVEHGETRLGKARHPLIDPAGIVPIDIQIGGAFDTLVITGPNTGGKTVALKTLGLLTLMAMCGLMLPVSDESTVCFYRRVLADIGDEQSIEQSLSTFSGHMTNIVSILEEADAHTLVLIDELGAGTDPVEGAALAVAIIDELRHRGAKIAATTHYPEIKVYALETPGVENASCEFDVATLRPTYRLLIGVPGRSNAFAISERLGLPDSIITAARKQISGENTRFEDVVSGLEEARQQLEQEKAAAAKDRLAAQQTKQQAEQIKSALEQQIETEMAHAREKAKGLVENVKFQSEALLAELEALKQQKDQADFASTLSDVKSTFKSYVRDLEETSDPIVKQKRASYRLPRKLKRGDRVFVQDLNTEGVVLKDQDSSGYIQVQTGIFKTKASLHNLRLIEEQKKATFEGGKVSSKHVVGSAKSTARSEVDLRGMDSGEALLELNRYLDNAVLAGLKTVTIIHGKGTGALRATVQDRLRKHRSVATFRIGTYGEGESGVTVAELK